MADVPRAEGSISNVTTGMTVVDAAGETVGTVDGVHLPDTETATGTDRPPQTSGNLLASVADMLSTDVGMSQDAQERLRRRGYVRVDASGLIKGHRYVPVDQIARVSGNEVRLSVAQKHLLRRAPGDRLS
jgi:hypothetical protein